MATISRTGATTFVTPSDVELIATRIFEAPRAQVWEAMTNPEHMKHWIWMPEGWTLPVCEMDLRPGGKWHFGWRLPDGTVMEMTGETREVEAPSRLVQTESWGGEWTDTLKTMLLHESGGQTTLAYAVRYTSNEQRERARATGMQEGWSASYDRLDDYLRTMPASAGTGP